MSSLLVPSVLEQLVRQLGQVVGYLPGHGVLWSWLAQPKSVKPSDGPSPSFHWLCPVVAKLRDRLDVALPASFLLP